MDYGKKERIGGFDLLKYKKDDMSFIRVSTIMGNWAIEYREDSVVFHHLNDERDDEQNEALHIIFVNAFMASSFIEADYQHDLMVAAGELEKRIKNESERVSEEEDAEILNKIRTAEEMKDFIDKECDEGA